MTAWSIFYLLDDKMYSMLFTFTLITQGQGVNVDGTAYVVDDWNSMPKSATLVPVNVLRAS